MVKITHPLTADWQRANARAVANAAKGLRAERIGCRTYRVASAHSGDAYTVEIESIIRLEARCTCPHGNRADAKGVCWHKSAAIAAAVARIAAAEREQAPTTPSAEQARAMEVERYMARFARQ